MFGPTPLRDIFLVAGFELREAIRSKRLLLFAALYLLVAAFASYTFVDFLNRVKPITNVSAMMNNGGPNGRADTLPPSMLTAAPQQKALFARGSPFRGLLRGTVTGSAAMEFLVNQPPITLFNVLVSFAMLPVLIMLTSSESIAQEHQQRGVRFVALRTGRMEFVLGKVLGQGSLIAVLTLFGGGVCMAMADWKLQDFEFGPALSAMLLFWPRVLAFCVSFLGLAALCSMNSSSTIASRTFSIMGLAGLWMTHHLSQVYLADLTADSSEARFFRALDFLSPYAHENYLWYPERSTYGGAMAALVFLGALYVAVGLIFYRRKDL